MIFNMIALKQNKIKNLVYVICFVLLFVIVPFLSLAQFNPEINYQGKLTNSSSSAVTDGDYNMRFWLIASSTAATTSAVWSEEHIGANKVQVNNGLFSVMLGSLDSLSGVDFNQTLYLGVEIGGTGSPAWDGEMSPRKILGTVPSAFVAEDANTLAGLATTSFLRADEIDTMQATSSSALLTLIQNGAGKIMSLFSGVTEVFTALSNGNIGIATTTPSHKLTVIGNTYLGGNLSLTGSLSDSVNATGTSGQILSSTGTSTQWKSASSLGLGDGTFLGLSDTQNSFTANRLIFTDSGATSLTDSANLTFDGTNLGVGTTTPNNLIQVYDLIDFNNTDFNSKLGYQAGKNIVSGAKYNTFLGYKAGYSSSTGSTLAADFNTVVGYQSLYSNTTGSQNTANGAYTLFSNTTGSSNIANGYQSLYSNSTGIYNIAIGTNALYLNTTGSSNIANGFSSLSNNITGAYNLAEGYNAGRYLANGSSANASTSKSIFLGYDTRASIDGGINEIVIGAEAIGNGSNTVTLGSTTITKTILQGNVGIGTSTPIGRLEVANDTNSGNVSYLSNVNTGNGAYTELNIRNANTSDTYNDGLRLLTLGTGRTSNGAFVQDGSALVSGSNLAGGMSLATLGASAVMRFYTAGSADANERMRITSDGFVGIATTTPSHKLTVIGNTYLGGNLSLTGSLSDSVTATGTSGQILSSTGTSTQWKSASSLGLGDGTFLGLSDTQNSFTANRLIFTDSGATSLTDSANLTFDGTNLGVGAQNGIAFGGTRYIYASSTNDSVAFGENAGATFNSGTTYNLAIGFEAGRYASTSASDTNNFIGVQAGYNNTGGANNIIGSLAGFYNTGSYNNMFGDNAGYNNTGDNNIIIGLAAGQYNSGAFNQMIGDSAGNSNTGNNNSFFGSYSGRNNTGSYNNMLGYASGFDNTGSYNNIFGYYAGQKNTGSYNEIFGYQAGRYLKATSSIIIGSEAFRGGSASAFSAINNVAIGYQAGYNATTSANNNILLGYRAADNLTSGANNIVIGYDVDIASTTGSNQLNIGNLIFGTSLDGTGTTLSSGNVGIGTSTPTQALSVVGNVLLLPTTTTTSGIIYKGTDRFIHDFNYGNNGTVTTDGFNTFVGIKSGNTTMGSSATSVFHSSYNTVLGYLSFSNNTTGFANTALGYLSLANNTTGGGNVALGSQSLQVNTSAFNNTALGYLSMNANTSGSGNIGLGAGSLYANTIGTFNIGIGYYAGRYLADGTTANTSASSSIYIGQNTRSASAGSANEIVIGSGLTGNGTNTITIGSSTASSLFAGNVGIGTTTVTNKLTVAGDINISDTAQGYKLANNRILYASTTNVSTLAGIGAGNALLGDGLYSTVLGYQALYTATSSDFNTAVGYRALYYNNEGASNTANGYQSLFSNTTGSYNTANGLNTLYVNTTGSYNTANGYYSLYANTTGSYNTANGFNALAANTTGSNNTAIGRNSLYTNTTGSNNIAIGQGAGRFLTDGTSAASTTDNSLFLGYNTKALTDNDQNAIIIGYDTNGLGSNTVVLGNDSIVTTALKGNVGIGTTTPSVALTVSGNISVYDRLSLNDTDFKSALGYQAGKNVASGAQYNTFLGYQAGYSSSTASTNAADYNTAIGFQSLYSNTTGNSNAALGFQSLNSNTSGTGNVANGFNALYYNTTGGGNTASGYLSLHRNTSGMGNTGFGAYSLLNNATGSYNTAIGIDSLYYNTNASGTVALGYGTAWGTGDYNNQGGVYVGYGAGYSASSSSDYNTMIGYRSGYGVTTGARNILLGYNAGYSGTNLTTGSDNIIIGNNIGATSTAMTKGLNIGNLIFGTSLDGTGTTLSSGNVGIGTSTPVSRLAIEKLSYSSAGTAGINQYFTFNNSVASAVQYGNFGYLYATNTATTTIAGNMFKIEDSTLFGNTIRGFEVQTDRGTNTLGENTALSGFARTFGVRGTTQGDAGGTYEPAGVFGETAGTTQGNAIRAYSSSITTASLLKLFQASSTFAGTGLLMNFGNSGGSFSSTTASKFIDLQNAGTSMFTVGAYGKLTIGDGTTNNNAGIQVGYGGICVDNDGSCNASTTGRVSAVSYHTGNSDLAEMYFSGESLKTGEVVYVKGGLSVGKADNENKDKIIGVVSTKPGQVLGFDDTSLKINEKGYPIALAGRVPVRLSNENGAIKAGDELMLSSIPGVVMKASSTGKIIGTALEDFNETRAYSDTYINQFGDDLVDPVFIPINKDKDPRINDGCYFGGGNASGEEPCVPLKSLTKDEQIKEAEAIAKREAEERELAKLAKISSESIALENGKEVKVGQIVMFVDLRQRYLDEVGAEMVTAMTAKASTTKANEVGEETVWQRVVNLANNFVDGVLSVFTLKADRVEVKDQLCVDGVCLNADDLRNLLKNKEINQSVDGNQSNTLDEEDKNINPDNNNNSSSANSEEDTFTEKEEGNELDTNNENTIEEDSYKASEVLLDSEPLPSESVESTEIKSSEETPV